MENEEMKNEVIEGVTKGIEEISNNLEVPDTKDITIPEVDTKSNNVVNVVLGLGVGALIGGAATFAVKKAYGFYCRLRDKKRMEELCNIKEESSEKTPEE